MCFSLSPSWRQATDVTALFSGGPCAPGPLHKGLFEMQRGQCVCPAFGKLTIIFRHLADTDWTGAASGHLHGADVCVVSLSLIMCLFICVSSSEDVHLQLYISFISSCQTLGVLVFQHTNFCLNQVRQNPGKKRKTHTHKSPRNRQTHEISI